MEPFRDFVGSLVDFGVPEIAEYILSLLDYNNLRNAECVCKLWCNVIRDGNIWKRCLTKMLCNPTFKKLYQRVPQWVNVQPEDPRFFKLACHAIMRYNQRLLYNWMTGSQQEEWAPNINVPEERVCFDMNSRYLVICQQNGKISIENRDVNVEPEKTNIQELRLRSGIHCMHLDENTLICGGFEGVIQICDIHSGKMLHRFTERETDCVQHLRFENKLLITCSSMEGNYEGRLTVWSMDNLELEPKISRVQEIVFDAEKIYGIGFDEKLTAVLIKKKNDFEVQIRQTQNSLNLIHSMHYTSHVFSGFHYENGFVAAGSDDGKIRIWDSETGTCRRILLRPSYDIGPVWLRFNSKFLVTNNSQGISIWNFKEAVNNKLDPYLKLFCCSFQTRSATQSNMWNFLMDNFEIIRFEHPIIGPLPGGYRGKSHIVRHQFLSPWFY